MIKGRALRAWLLIFLVVAVRFTALEAITGTGKARWCSRPSPVCPCACRASITVPRLGGTFRVDFVGSMSMVLTSLTDVNGICTATQQVNSFFVLGSNPVLGTMEINLDVTASTPPSVLVNTTPMQLFPARHDVYAHATATISTLPGIRLRTMRSTPFHMRSGNVQAFPAIDELYTLVSPVMLEDEANPGFAVAMMKSATIRVGPGVECKACQVGL